MLGIPQALLGMAKARAAALPCRKGAPKGPDGLRVSAMRQGVTGTKLRPVSVAPAISIAEAVLSAPSFIDVIVGAKPAGTGVAVGEGLATGVEAAENRDADWEVGAGLGVSPTPPQPAKENAIKDKQISERIPGNQNESWRRIDYLSAI